MDTSESDRSHIRELDAVEALAHRLAMSIDSAACQIL